MTKRNRNACLGPSSFRTGEDYRDHLPCEECEPEEQEELPKVYLIFLYNQQPQRIASTVNLLESWLGQLEERQRKNDWWRPIEFKDEEGTLIAAYQANAIAGVVMGVTVNNKQLSALAEAAKKEG